MAMAQRRTAEIGRGLFLVRYVGADDQAQPPRVTIAIEPGSEANVGFVLHPDHSEPVLQRPGTSLVVRAASPGLLGVEVEPQKANGSIAATINIEPLNQGPAQSAIPQASQQATVVQSGDLRILAHVAGVGDVYVKPNEWLGGPTAPSRIEGISIEWPTRPAGLDIGYAVKTAQPVDISGRMVGVGSFAGTRGRAMPLTGLLLQLSGADSSHYQFAVEALFLGSPILRTTGQRVVASGPTGREPLVGLRVTLEELRPQEQPDAAPVAVARPRGSGRVRVFRSRAKQVQAAT